MNDREPMKTPGDQPVDVIDSLLEMDGGPFEI